MIYVCIPAHDEAATIGVLMWKVRKVMGEFGRDYRIVVHDDGSTDDTASVLERYRRALPLTVLRSEERIGYGASLERLLRHVEEVAAYPKRDAAVVLQGDFTDNPEDIVGLVKALEGGADIVGGCLDPMVELPDNVRWTRRLGALLLRRLVRGAPVADPWNGLRAYRVIVLRKAIRSLREGERLLTLDGWAANLELLVRLTPHARRVAESPAVPRYELRARPTRFRAGRTLRSLWGLRGATWPRPETPGEGPRSEAA